MKPSPPPVARWLLGVFLPHEAAESLRGDLDEEYSNFVRPGRGRVGAGWWYRSQVVRTVWNVRIKDAMRSRTVHSAAGGSSAGPRRLFDDLATDAGLALRGLRLQPGFAALVIATLALGIGTSTAMFTVVNDVFLRPLAFRAPERLVMLWETDEERGWTHMLATPANVIDWRARVEAFDDVALVDDSVSDVALAFGDRAVQVSMSKVSGNAFEVLGVLPRARARISLGGDV